MTVAGLVIWIAVTPIAMATAQSDVVMSFKFFPVQYGTRLVAFDAIPAARYSYRPTPAPQSIGFIAQHLEAASYGLCERLGVSGRIAP